MKKNVGYFILAILSLSISKQTAIAQCDELIWADEFDVNGALNTDYWNYLTGGDGFGNNELQYYTDRIENSRIEDGILIIEAIQEDYLNRQWTSARVHTRNKVDFLYGTIEARLKLPGGLGMWAAFWLMPTESIYGGWPNSGEYDIMEYVGYDTNTVYSTTHTGANSGGNGIGDHIENPTAETEFHNYKLVWTPDSMVTYMDDVKFFKYVNPKDGNTDIWPYNHEFYPILNLAVGGNWGGARGIDWTIDSRKYEIDYVRLYKSAQTLLINGDEEVYSNDSALQYNIHYVEGWTYEWIAPEGTEIIGDIDTSWIELNWGCDDDTLLCKVVGSCIDDTIRLPIKVVLPEIDGPTFFTAGETGLEFSIPEKTNTNYLWIVPEDATITSGQGTNAITVDWGSTADSVKIEITNNCGTETIAQKMWLKRNYPYPDMVTPHTIPGRIESTDYDIGGEGVAYHDLDANNQGGGPRQNEGVDTENNDINRPNVGWIDSGEWLEYTVQVEETGVYGMTLRMASNSSATRGSLTVYVNGEVRASFDPPFTASWSTFRSEKQNITLTEQDTLIRLDMGAGEFNIGYFEFGEPTSVNEILSSKLNINPNPFNDVLTIESEVMLKLIDLVDMSGKLIIRNSSISNNNVKMNTSNIQDGMYILVVEFENGTRAYQKIIK